MTKQLKELYFALLLTAVSFMLTVQSFRYSPDSSDFPRFITVLMTGFAAALAVKSYLNFKKEKDVKSTPLCEILKAQKLPLFVFLGTSLYVAGINYLGYFTSSVIFLIGSMTFFSKEKKWKLMILSTAGFLAVVYALFVWFLNLRMPSGLII